MVRKRKINKAAPLDPTVRGNEPAKGSPFANIGAPGTALYGGYVLNKERDTDLIGQQRYITYSNMLSNTSIAAAGVRYFVNLVSKAEWKAEPADESAEAEKMADLVEEIMGDMSTPWHRVIRRAAMYCMWGFSVQEWIAKKRDDGVIGYQDIEPRAQSTIERWDIDVNGTVLGMMQRNPQSQEEIYLPRGKCLYLVDDTLNDSPEGLGLFRHIIKAAQKLKRYELLEAWGFETDLRGIPIARGPLTQLETMVNQGTLSRAQADALIQPMIDFVSSHNKTPEMGMVIDSQTWATTDERQAPSNIPQWNVELLQGSPTSVAEVAAAIERLNREIARVLGVEQLLLGSSSVGSHALSKDKTQTFGLIVDSCLKELKETFEKDFLVPLWELNGWDPKLKPSFKIEKIQYRDIEQIVDALDKLASAGAPIGPDDPVVNEVRDLMGLSNRPDVELTDPDMSLMGEEPTEPKPKEE